MISSIIFAFGTLIILWILRRILLLGQLPPGLWGYPIIGSGFEMDFGKLPELRTKWHRKYGDIFSFSLPIHQDIIVVNSYELIHEVLVKRSAEFSGRPTSIRLHALFGGNLEVAFHDDTPERRVLKKALNVSLKMYGETLLVLEDISISAIQDMVGKWRQNSGQVFNPKDDVSRLVYRIMSSLVFHREFSQRDAVFMRA